MQNEKDLGWAGWLSEQEDVREREETLISMSYLRRSPETSKDFQVKVSRTQFGMQVWRLWRQLWTGDTNLSVVEVTPRGILLRSQVRGGQKIVHGVW